MSQNHRHRWSSQFTFLLTIFCLCLVTLSFPLSSVAAASTLQPVSPLAAPTLVSLTAWLLRKPPNPYAPPLAWVKITHTVYPNQLARLSGLPVVVAQSSVPYRKVAARTTPVAQPPKQQPPGELNGDSIITETQNASPPSLLPPLPGGDGKTIYFTFDDGPSVGWTAQVLEILARYHAKATFFMIGVNAAKNPDLVQAVLKAGNTIGNHTYDHKSLRKMSRDGVANEVEATQKVLGDSATHCLRPPYGAMDKFTPTYAKELGFRLVMWTVDPRDWARPGVKVIVQRILARVYPGAIVLLHDGGGDRSQTVTALDIVLRQLSALGYHFEPYCTN
ncbi:MAG: polysaccharide deacetylase family protein [Caldilineaceae bacterium]